MPTRQVYKPMRICYLDETGHCGEKPNPQQPYETVVGVITDVTKLFKTQREHNNIIDVLQEAGINVSELKASELYRGRNEWSDLEPQNRDAVFRALLQWAEERKCKYVICPIDSSEFFRRKRDGCPICQKLLYPFEAAAVNATLAIQRENRNKKSNKGRTIVVFDEQKRHDERFLSILDGDLAFTDAYTGYKAPPRAKAPPRLDQIVDIPHFSKSHKAVLIQIADIAGYAVNRSIAIESGAIPEKYPGEATKIDEWVSIVAKSMISPSSIDPPGKDDLCQFYRSIRPSPWSARGMASKALERTR